MTVRIIKCFVVFAFFTLAVQGLFANPTTASPRNQFEAQCTVSVPEETCPPVTNIQAEFLPPDEAFATWDAIPNVSTYGVRVTDANQTIILNTVVYQNSLTFNGLVPGMSYTIEVCYACPSSNIPVCASRAFDYVIIDDLVVMRQGNPCHCQNNAGTYGTCPSSGSFYYSLNESRVYNVTLDDASKLSFLVEYGTVKIIGNCESDFTGLDTESHGEYDLPLPYYDLGEAKIHFHGTKFCISGIDVNTITSCDIAPFGKLSRLETGETASSSVLFPNPFSDVVYVQTDEHHDYTGTTSVLLYDAVGRLVLSQEVSNTMLNSGLFEINTSTLWAGFYWVSLLNNGVVLTTKRMIKVD